MTTTTRRNNAHGTEEREVLYPWHPWFGRVIRVHEVIRRGSGHILRCGFGGTGGRIELPSWMFDRAVCMSMSLAASPHISGTALTALKILLVDCGSGRDPLADRPDSDAGSDTRNPNRGDDHGIPARTSAKANTVRSLRSAGGGTSGRDSGLATSAGSRAADGDKTDGPPPRRSRTRRSGGTSGGRAR